MKDQKRVYCKECSTELGASADSPPREPCPSCGSMVRSMQVGIVEPTIQEPRDGIKSILFRGGISKKKGKVLEVKSGVPTYRASDGLPVREYQIIDKENDRYEHRITDEEGNILYSSPEGERLSDHTAQQSRSERPSSDVPSLGTFLVERRS